MDDRLARWRCAHCGSLPQTEIRQIPGGCRTRIGLSTRLGNANRALAAGKRRSWRAVYAPGEHERRRSGAARVAVAPSKLLRKIAQVAITAPTPPIALQLH